MPLELLNMSDADRYALAALYMLASVTAGFAAIAVATNVVRRATLTARSPRRHADSHRNSSATTRLWNACQTHASSAFASASASPT
jgi:hypothetical protein